MKSQITKPHWEFAQNPVVRLGVLEFPKCELCCMLDVPPKKSCTRPHTKRKPTCPAYWVVHQKVLYQISPACWSLQKKSHLMVHQIIFAGGFTGIKFAFSLKNKTYHVIGTENNSMIIYNLQCSNFIFSCNIYLNCCI